MSKIFPNADIMQPITRLSDVDVFLIHWSGGLQTAKFDETRWRILPIFYSGMPHVNSFCSLDEIYSFMKQKSLRFIAYQQINWINGGHISHWRPFIPGQPNFHQSPADLWGNVSSNLGKSRTAPLMEEIKSLTSSEEVYKIFDAASDPERLALSISLSLRNLDTSVERISSFYHEEMVNLMANGGTDGSRHSTIRDQSLYANVHSFFLHLGSARDYLATLIAFQLKLDITKIDSMAKLINILRGPNINGSALFDMLVTRGYLEQIGEPSTKWKAAGWLELATALRNEFVHRRNYGQTMAEKMGHLQPVNSSSGLYRYFRPISFENSEEDIFDTILSHYETVNELFFSAANASGFDVGMMAFTDKDIISIELSESNIPT